MTWCFLFILVAVAVGVSIKRNDFFSPVTFFVLLYSGLLAIYFLRLTPLQTPWALSTHILFWGSIAMYLSGCMVVYGLVHLRKDPNIYSLHNTKTAIALDAKTFDWNRFHWVVLVCFIIFLIAYIDGIIITGSIPAFTSDTDTSRLKFFGANMLTSYGLHFGPLAAMLAFEMLLFKPVRLSHKLIPLFVVILVTLLYGVIGSRLDIFRFALFAIVLINYGKKRISLKILVTYGAIGVAVFLFYALLRGSDAVALDTFSTTIKLHMPKEFLWAANFYGYVANNFWNFDYGVRQYVDGDNYFPFSYGFSLFRSFFMITFSEGAFVDMFNFQDLYNSAIIMIKALNTVYFAWHFYTDFSYYGVFILSFLSGLFVTLFYCNTLIKATLFRSCIWAVIVGMIFLSFMVPFWEFWMSLMNVIVIIIAHGRLRICSTSVFSPKLGTSLTSR